MIREVLIGSCDVCGKELLTDRRLFENHFELSRAAEKADWYVNGVTWFHDDEEHPGRLRCPIHHPGFEDE